MSTTMGTTSDEAEILRREIEQRRNALGRDLGALGDHVSPARMVERRRAAASQSVRGIKDRLMGVADDATTGVTDRAGAVADRAGSMASAVAEAPEAARSAAQGNPLAMGLISFGVGLVAATVIPTSRQERKVLANVEPALAKVAEEAGSMVREDLDELVPAAKSAAVDLREDAAGAARIVADRAQAKVGEVQEQAKHAAADVADTAKEGTPPSTGAERDGTPGSPTTGTPPIAPV